MKAAFNGSAAMMPQRTEREREKRMRKKYMSKADMLRLIGFMDDILRNVNPKSRIAEQADLAKANLQRRLGHSNKKKA